MKQLINSALRKKLIAEREAKAEAEIRAKAKRILNVLAIHCVIFDVIAIIICIAI